MVNRIIPIAFCDLIKKHNLEYDISKDGYNWKILLAMCKNKGITNINDCITKYIMENYDLSWKSFKELFDITI